MLRGDPLRDHVAAVSCGVCNGVAVLDLDYAEDSDADTDANFVMTGAGQMVEVQATAEKVAVQRGAVLALLALARKGIAQARRPAEARGDVSDAPADRRPPRHRHAQSRQARRDARTAGAATASRRCRRANSDLARAGGDRHDVLAPMRGIKARSRRAGVRACRRSPTIPAWWSMRSTARPASIRRAGPGRARISATRWRRSRACCASAARSRPTQRKAHFVSALCVAWPDGHLEEFEGRVDGTLVWPPRGDKGFGYDPMFLPDGFALTFGEMSARGEARPAADGPRPVAPGARIPQARGGVP